MTPAFAWLEWTRPLGFLALALPVALVLLSMRPERPRARAVGTFAIWKRIASAAPVAGRRRRGRVPPDRWLAVAALALGGIALAGPRPETSERARPWRVVVDRSPSMHLAHTDERGAPSGAGTRLVAALAPALRWLDEIDGGAPREWSDGAVEIGAIRVQREPPDDWRVPPHDQNDEPVWERHDREGVAWITDRAPDPAPARAAVFASGGGPVPGAIGESGTSELVWDGESVSERAGALRPGRVSIDADLPAPLADFVRLWAASRGLVEEGDAPLALEVRVLGEGEVLDQQLARDGWSLAARGRAGGVPAAVDGRPLASWLFADAAGRALPVVAWRSGLVATSLVSCEEPRGDPALFAVSWSELCDRALAPRPGIVSIAERRSAGPALLFVRGAPLPRSRAGDFPVAALLAGLSAVLALLAGAVSIARA